MPLSPFEPRGLAPGGSICRPHPRRCCHSKDTGRVCSRRPPSVGNSHKTIRSRSSVPSSAPLYLPIPHVRIPTDSTRRSRFRVHRRDLSPQSGKTLRPNAVCKDLPYGRRRHGKRAKPLVFNGIMKCVGGLGSPGCSIKKAPPVQGAGGPVRQLPSPELNC